MSEINFVDGNQTNPRAHHSEKEVIAKKVFLEKLDVLHKGLLFSVPTSFICSLVVFVTIDALTNRELLFTWLGAVFFTSIFRLFGLYFYQQNPNHQIHYAIFLVGITLSAALWGVADSLLMPKNDLLAEMLIIVMVAGVTSGAVQTLQANRLVVYLYLSFSIVPMAIWLFLQQGFSYHMLAIAMSTYYFYMMIAATRAHRILTRSLTLSTENMQLNKDLLVSNEQLQKAYLAVEENEVRLRKIQDDAPIGMAISALNDQWIEVNRAMCEIVGYSKDELMSLTFKDITYYEDLPEDLHFMEKLIQGKLSTFVYEKRYVHKNGQLIWVLKTSSLMRDKKGKPLYFISQIQNINERKMNEKLMVDLNFRTQSMLHELQQREHDMTLISKMNDMLQTCNNSDEAYSIIQLSAHDLFSNYSGGLCMINKKTNQLETVRQWGDHQILSPHFSKQDCWAIREGHIYINADPQKNPVCQHYQSLLGDSICLPLIVKSGVLGLLSLHGQKTLTPSEYFIQLANSFHEAIKLSLANIQLRETLHEQAVHDSLTGLFNRRYLNEILTNLLLCVLRYQRPLTVCMLDIDHFKQFNDTYGHEAGDEILKFIGMKLAEFFHGSDVACRFGGEEFIVVLADTDIQTAAERARDLAAEIKVADVYFNLTLLPKVTVSIGLAEAPLHGATGVSIIHSADEALYAAKKAGRDRIEIYELDPAQSPTLEHEKYE